MLLQTSGRRDVPENTVQLTKSEAVAYQLKLMCLYSDPGDRFFVQYSAKIATFLSLASSCAIHYFYRGIFNVSDAARTSTILISTICPTFLNFYLHKKTITNDIVVEKWACPYCYHLRSAFMQGFFGFLWPFAFTAVSSPVLARKAEAVAGVPPVNHFREFYKFVNDKTKHVSRNGLLLFIINCAVGGILANLQVNESKNFNENFEYLLTKHHKEQTKADNIKYSSSQIQQDLYQ